MRDICNILHKIRHPAKANLSLNDQELFRLKQEITVNEQRVLRAMAFNVRIIVPYSYIGPFLKALNFGGTEQEDLKRSQQLKQMLQCTCSLMNDSLRTELCITYKSHEIAVGMIHLASRLLSIEIPYRSGTPHDSNSNMSNNHNSSESWYHLFNISQETLRSISEQMIQMYSDYKQTKSSSVGV